MKVSQTFQAGLTPQTAIGNGWTCRIAGQLVACTRTDILPGLSDYPAIAVAVGIGGGACQFDATSAEVTLAGARTDFTSIKTALSGCLTVTQAARTLIVNSDSTVTLTVSAAKGVPLQGSVDVNVFLPAGITSDRQLPYDPTNGWFCLPTGSQIVHCLRSDSVAGPSYQPLTIPVRVALDACPNAVMTANVVLGGSPQGSAAFPLDLFGCLRFESRLDLGNVPVKTRAYAGLLIASFDQHDIAIQALDRDQVVFTISGLTFGVSTGLSLPVVPQCYGPNSNDFRVIASGKGGEVAVFDFSTTAFGVPDLLSFALQDGTVLSAGKILGPDHSQTLVAPLPELPSCPTPTLVMNFLPRAADGTNFDASFNPASGSLYSGTVAGTIELKAQLNGADIQPIAGPASVQLVVPSTTGVIQNLSIDSRTGSAFLIGVSGYSTPRETGPAATTEVCFVFSPASGANLPMNKPFCALKQDIAIWYERPASYPTGSKFKASATVSFNGDVKAIGQIKAWIRNKEGDGIPSCIDFQSGASQPCR